MNVGTDGPMGEARTVRARSTHVSSRAQITQAVHYRFGGFDMRRVPEGAARKCAVLG